MQTIEEKREYQKKYYKLNKEKIKKYQKTNKKKIAARSKAYRNANKEKVSAQRKTQREANLEKSKASVTKYYKNNKDKIKTQRKAFEKANPKTMKAKYKRDYDKQKLKPNFKLNNDMSSGIRHSLKNGSGKNGNHWEELVPYTLNDLIKRLKKTLPPDYTWDDYINGKTDLSIDHIIPLSVHNFKSYTDTDFQKAWALKNLSLLPLIKNISKGANLIKHFQPSLLL